MTAQPSDNADPVSPKAGRLRWVALAGGVVVLAAAAVGVYLAFFRPPPHQHPGQSRDPRLAYSGPFRNINPAVGYAPESRCGECHKDIAESYAAHPMGRSLVPAAGTPGPPAGEKENNPFEALRSTFRVGHEGDRVWHRRTQSAADGHTAAELEWPVHYVIGSGARGHSYLTDRDGYLLQTPVSWYSQKNRWDLSPGFGEALLTGRAVLPECLFCHANRAHHLDGSMNHYKQPAFEGHAIGCQRCHGPGELHLSGAGKGPDGIDPTIVNPKHLAPSLRSAVCEQCHLTAVARTPRRGLDLYDFRPGMPLEQFLSAFVLPPGSAEGQKAVSHVEQMYRSRCFLGSEGPGQLGCVSCHDPHRHVPASQRVSHYRGRCLTCHETRGCGLPEPKRLSQSPQDSCIDCHMPRFGAADVPHTAATDHRIVVPGKPPRPDTRPGSGGFPIVSFYRGRGTTDAAEDDRDLGVTLGQLAGRGNALVLPAMRRALPLLDAALERAPDDVPAGEAKGYALGAQQRWADSLAAFEAVLSIAPERETALVGAAATAEALGRPDVALGYWRRAVEANPWAPVYRRSLVLLLVKKSAWGEVKAHAETWLRQDPFSAEARSTRVAYLLAVGDKDEARREFARIEALAPDNLPELKIRFEKKLR